MFVQAILNCCIAAGYYTLVGLGFYLIYRTAGFLHFAHGIVITTAAYFVLLIHVYMHFPLPLACAVATVMGGIAGCLIYVAVIRPLSEKRASPTILMLASLGVYTVVQNVLSMVFGDETRLIYLAPARAGFELWGARMTPIQAYSIVLSILAVLVLWLFLSLSRTGKGIRAVANDPELAEISGVDCGSTVFWVFFFGSTLGGLAGVLAAMDAGVNTSAGMNLLMMGVVAVVIGGGRTPLGVIVGAVLLGSVQQLGVLVMDSRWQSVVTYGILLVFLLVRTKGALGRSTNEKPA